MPQRKILLSPGFGAGWTTWNGGEVARFMLTYQPIIEFLEAGNRFTRDDSGHLEGYELVGAHPLLEKLQSECLAQFGQEYVCILGASDLEVVTVNGQVRVEEYDGNESLRYRDDDDGWM